jgi:DNA-binding MurR/RpiR family transcriptional regulator
MLIEGVDAFMQKIEVGRLLPMIVSLDYEFTRSEKKVAKIILEKAEEVIYSTITDFSELADVGEATIIRFCRKLGFKGYQGFKMALAQEITMNKKKGTMLLNGPIDIGDTIEVVAQKFYHVSERALKETLSLIDYEVLEKVAGLVNNARRVYFFGVGFSGVSALEAKFKFMQIGLSADAYTDNHFMAMVSSTMNEDDVVVGISHSGSAIETVKALKIAKDNGAKTIAITHHAKSPITKEAHMTLLNGSKEGPLQGGAIGTKIAQLFVIDLIYTQVVMLNEEKAVELKKKARDAVQENLY